MTIRRKLALSFLAIVTLFAVNLGIYFWGDSIRESTLREVLEASQRLQLITEVSRQIDNNRRELTLRGGLMADTGAAPSPNSPDDIQQFQANLRAISDKIEKLRDLSDVGDREQAEQFLKLWERLRGAWETFYLNFGVDQVKAITVMAIDAEPVSPIVVDRGETLKERQSQRLREASEQFASIQAFTRRAAVAIFLISLALAVVIAWWISRYIAFRLSELREGAARIGAGDLDLRIPVRSNDELGQLSENFNEMTGKLASSRDQLTQANAGLSEANRELALRNDEVEEQKRHSEALLHNILPADIARELREKGSVDPRYYEDVTILFSDFVGFTLSTEKLAAEDLVHLLQDYFTAFDQIMESYGIEKLKTIGDAYMCAGGLGLASASHPVDAVLAAFEMLNAVRERDRPGNLARWEVRIGIHTGSVIAGVVGIRKFAFDVWGDTVNYASRMETAGAPNRVNVSQSTYLRIKDFFDCEHRGKIATKEKRQVDMYFVNGILPALLSSEGENPPPAFLRRYQIYFRREPLRFPAFLGRPGAEASPTTGD